ncbi:MAG: cytochrome aa3 quinol oxidase subunit II [Alicyclobacillaceae bacterium]|jgi:cytochrome aa3-600 menaquinol oxidase subunit 2|uniref:cytochrome c oxidase subunit II n=1 Tax=Alicyclobacillus sp. SP_1 TaxID=2942475 RepID=UPI0021582F02|nr:cytochrome c oxidase subunit II transmembrane domain-containing protein [Alicyclobacillus sp. SP_1]MCY0889227.1 cytochrome aa3 quinol oxidase subunit II [Alicyclobacillaceae bacterium]MCY0895005.1 cytochrome aa3 quinol oxidase subunit II [Alicyclobacillaceae bacterium]
MRSPKRRLTSLLLMFVATALLATGCGSKYAVMSPAGPVARSELHLIVWSFAIMIFVVIVVLVLFVMVLVKFRNKPDTKSVYTPDWEGSRKLETIWTVVPIILVAAIAVPAVLTTGDLESPPKSKYAAVTIDVIAARWKWIFQYPKQGIETVDYVVIPARAPIDFQLTSVGPMNTLWIPQLGGMEFAMPGKDLKLWLEAGHTGTYLGRSGQFSGKGFVHMQFETYAKSEADFNAWVQHVKATQPALSESLSRKLIKQASVVKPMTFSSYPSDQALFAQTNQQ